MAKYKTEIFTGIRPSNHLTVANAIGAVHPIMELQKSGMRPLVFVADLHALTDKEPKDALQYRRDVVADYIALGMDPANADIFLQSDIAAQVAILTLYLQRHVSIAELTRIPTLKDKLKSNQEAENATAMLVNYPVMMAADILLQRSRFVPVGEDQQPHLEMTRLLAKRFNAQYGDVLPIVQNHNMPTLRILSLKGEGKMSKSQPEGAIFLTDSMEDIADKIKRAATAMPGEFNPALESLFLIAEHLVVEAEDKHRLAELKELHTKSEKVMVEFKQLLTKIVQQYLQKFQEKRAVITADPDFIADVLATGKRIANENATETLNMVEAALFG